MGRTFGLLLSLLGGVWLGIGAFGLFSEPPTISVTGAVMLAWAIGPGLGLFFAAWVTFTLDGIQRHLLALRTDTTRMSTQFNHLTKARAAAEAKPRVEPSLTRRS